MQDTIPTNKFLRYVSPASLSNTNSIWSNNIWWRGDGGAGDERWWTDNNVYLTYANWLTKSQVDDELRDDPLIDDPNNDSWELSDGSPCIDGGTWLTSTAGSGSGTSVTVDNARYFYWGYGLTNGDFIKIGSNPTVEVIDVNYNTNVITVDQSISWNNNDDVGFDYVGSTIDIGAFESSIVYQEVTSPEISQISLLESNPLDTNSSYGWINISAVVTDDIELTSVRIIISCPNQSDINVSMDYLGSDIYYYYSTTTFSDSGDYSYHIYAKDSDGNVTISDNSDFSMPPNWDINEDGSCDVLDYTLISNHYGETGQNGWIREDIDNNGEINILDLVLMSNHYGETW
jgi:hypothetical protein